MNWIIERTARLEKGMDAAVKQSPIFPIAFYGDSKGHTWRVTITENGEPADLSGATVRGWFFRVYDSESVMETGTISGNVATVDLPPEVYAYSDDVIAIMRITKGNTVVTVDSIRFRVGENLTDQIIDPGEVIPANVDELIDQIERMETATEAAENAVEQLYSIFGVEAANNTLVFSITE